MVIPDVLNLLVKTGKKVCVAKYILSCHKKFIHAVPDIHFFA